MKLADYMFINKDGEIKPRNPWFPVTHKHTADNRYLLWTYACDQLGRCPSDEEFQEWVNITFPYTESEESA